MKLIVAILCALFQILAAPGGYGQRRAAPARTTPNCPQLVIACPLETVGQDTRLRFSALVAGEEADAPLAYTWALTGATISQGNGTPTITVDTAGLGGRRITATVAVSGLARECQSIASCAVYVAKPRETRRPNNETRRLEANEPRRPDTDQTRQPGANEARRLDAYGDLAFDLEKARLGRFARQLQAAPDSQGYIIVYGGRCDAEQGAEERAERAKEWLVNQHGIDASRIVAIDGGYRETPATEIYIGPIDASLPEPTGSTRPLDNSRCK